MRLLLATGSRSLVTSPSIISLLFHIGINVHQQKTLAGRDVQWLSMMPLRTQDPPQGCLVMPLMAAARGAAALRASLRAEREFVGGMKAEVWRSCTPGTGFPARSPKGRGEP